MPADWLDTYIAATDGIPSPRIFRLWSGISVLAATLERRVYTVTRATRPAYPNLYITLTGLSASGKTEAINIASSYWAQLKGFHLSPDDITNASFLDALHAAIRTFMNGGGASIYSALCVRSSELGVLLPQYDMGFLSVLSHIYDNPPKYDSKRRDETRSVTIDQPIVNILGGVTPAYLGDLLPETAWGQGFTSRMIFIHGHYEESADADMFRPSRSMNTVALHSRLRSIFELGGEAVWSERARAEFNAWFRAGMPPAPEHTRLQEYRRRRHIHILKLSMIAAVAAGRDLDISLEDFERALEWLIEAEAQMPDVFRAMAGKSDQQTINELHYFLYTKWSNQAESKRQPIHEREVWRFLSDRVESYRIAHLIEAAERSGALKRAGAQAWLPMPMNWRTEV